MLALGRTEQACERLREAIAIGEQAGLLRCVRLAEQELARAAQSPTAP